MRVIEHPLIVERARDWLWRVDAEAREIERATEREQVAQRDKLLVDDRRYFVELLDGCVMWVRLALPPLALPTDPPKHPLSPEEIALLRLGVTDAAGATVDEVVRRHYLRVLEASDANTRVAAHVLGVSMRSVQRFLLEPWKRHRR